MDEKHFKYKSNRMIAHAKLLERFLQHVGEDFRKGSETVLEVNTANAEMKCNIVPEIAKLSASGYNDAFRGNYLARWSVREDNFGLEVRTFDINTFVEILQNRAIITALQVASSMYSCEKPWEDVTDIEELSEAIISQIDKYVNDVTKAVELVEKEVKKMAESVLIKFESKND